MAKNLPATQDYRVVTYQARSGDQITLTIDAVRNFLVMGKKELVTEQEIVFYMGICKARGLNPFKKDCYLVKYDTNPAAIIVAIDFYRSRAKAQKDCHGWQKGVICLNKKDGSIRNSNGLVLPTEELVGGWFEAQPVGWDAPLRLEVNLSGYAKGNAFWTPQKAPSMISKVAESQGLRTCWPDEFGGTISAEEIGELSEALTAGDNMLPPSGGDITPKSEPDSKPIDFSKLKNFPAFAALWKPNIQDLHPDDQATRTQHLDLYLNKNTQAAATQHKMPPAKAAEKVLDHFIARFEEIWGKFLTWENMPEHPWNQEKTEPVTEPGAEAGPAEKAEAETTGEEGDPGAEGEAEEPFEARKNRVWGLVVKKYGATKDMKANLGIARSADINEGNVDEIEGKVTA